MLRLLISVASIITQTSLPLQPRGRMSEVERDGRNYESNVIIAISIEPTTVVVVDHTITLTGNLTANSCMAITAAQYLSTASF